VSGAQMICAKTAKPIEIQFGGQTGVIPGTLVLDWVQVLLQEGARLKGRACPLQRIYASLRIVRLPPLANVPAQARRKCGLLPIYF